MNDRARFSEVHELVASLLCEGELPARARNGARSPNESPAGIGGVANASCAWGVAGWPSNKARNAEPGCRFPLGREWLRGRDAASPNGVTVCARHPPGPQNEDMYALVAPPIPWRCLQAAALGPSCCVFGAFAVFDGHGGRGAAVECALHLFEKVGGDRDDRAASGARLAVLFSLPSKVTERQLSQVEDHLKDLAQLYSNHHGGAVGGDGQWPEQVRGRARKQQRAASLLCEDGTNAPDGRATASLDDPRRWTRRYTGRSTISTLTSRSGWCAQRSPAMSWGGLLTDPRDVLWPPQLSGDTHLSANCRTLGRRRPSCS